jgi:hypothetical protein
MKEFKPNGPYTVPVKLLIPTIKTVKGVRKNVYPDDGVIIYCSVRTFGGTERVVNDVLVLENTATLETFYRPDIKANCRLLINGVPFEIMGEPENINMRNQYMIIKAKAVKGGA